MDGIKTQIRVPATGEVVIEADGGWLHFSGPHRVIVAQTVDQVVPALRQIENLVNSHGWYAAGFLGYEAAPAFDPAHRTHEAEDETFPCLWFGLYPEPRQVSLPAPSQPGEILDWHPSVDRGTYDRAIARIREYIGDGRTYQVNYTLRLTTQFAGDPWGFFLQLNQNENEHAAFVDTGRYLICSASPELFFHLEGDTITCRPMKGTVRRGRTNAEDREQAEWLRSSEKNRAENVMIVDMVRNDLGRIAEIGSVHVPELFSVERYPTLWQMTSTVRARTNATVTEIFSALFPCASITGAPKVSTMKIISSLETKPRRIYTGSIGYLAPERTAKFNVAIRTALVDRSAGSAEYGIGGGIVWDSTSADEYDEALLKARALTLRHPDFSLLETILWTEEGGYFLQEKHIDRLLDSADYFGYPASREQTEQRLKEAAAGFGAPRRVRLLLDQTGKLSIEARSAPPATGGDAVLKFRLARIPIHSSDVFLYHKTTHREVYRRAFESAGSNRGTSIVPGSDPVSSAGSDVPHAPDGIDDVLLFNERGELTEFTLGNLVAELNGQFLTPPVSSGLLPGTFRAHLLETGQVAEQIILLEELRDITRIFRINSVRKWQEAVIPDAVRKATL